MNNGSREQSVALAHSIIAEVGKAFIGQEALLTDVMTSLLAGGHVLIEGVPGLGKTLLVRALAATFGGTSQRVQFTPDLMPSDITGHLMFNAQKGEFIVREGPVFTHILVADEINRSPAKTQAALFEAMQEYQVSIDGQSRSLPKPFMTLATQNPYEHEGTYPLPDAQKDRFLLKLLISYPDEMSEREMVEKVTTDSVGEGLDISDVNAVTDINGLLELQTAVSVTKVDSVVHDYAIRIVRATRGYHGLSSGSGPRGGIALIRTAKAVAFLNDRDFVIPDDIQKLAVPVLRHRVRLTPESEIEGIDEGRVVQDIVDSIEAPRK